MTLGGSLPPQGARQVRLKRDARGGQYSTPGAHRRRWREPRFKEGTTMRLQLARRGRCVFGSIAVILLAASSASAAPVYTVTDFGPAALSHGSITPPPDLF